MAGDAVGDLRAVGSVMTGGTFGHDRIPVPLLRAISVKAVMTILAGETVFTAVVLEVAEQPRVALAALACRERHRIAGIL